MATGKPKVRAPEIMALAGRDSLILFPSQLLSVTTDLMMARCKPSELESIRKQFARKSQEVRDRANSLGVCGQNDCNIAANNSHRVYNITYQLRILGAEHDGG